MLMLEECKEALWSWQNLAASGTTALQFGHVTLAPKPTNCASYHSSDARQRLYPGTWMIFTACSSGTQRGSAAPFERSNPCRG